MSAQSVGARDVVCPSQRTCTLAYITFLPGFGKGGAKARRGYMWVGDHARTMACFVSAVLSLGGGAYFCTMGDEQWERKGSVDESFVFVCVWGSETTRVIHLARWAGGLAATGFALASSLEAFISPL